jgi:hypothetical protein
LARKPSSSSNSRSASTKSTSTTKSTSKKRKVHPKRTGIVWTVFVGAMTFAGGALVLSDGWKGGQATGPLVNIAERAAPRWRQIVIHESGSLVGSMEDLSRQHASMGMPSLGFHFVVGNGNGEQNGAVLMGPRWNAQQHGGSVADAIEVCVVGDTSRRPLTDTQLQSLVSVVNDLARHYGIDATNIVRQQDRGGPSSFVNDAEWNRVIAAIAE